MAITNAQQYQQLVNKPADGKRPGYRGPGGYQGRGGYGASKSSSPKSTGPSFDDVSRASDDDKRQTYSAVQTQTGAVKGGGKAIRDYADRAVDFEDSVVTPNQIQRAQDAVGLNQLESLYDRGVGDSGLPGVTGAAIDIFEPFRTRTLRKNIDFFRSDPRTRKARLKYGETLQGYQEYMRARMAGEIDAAGNPIMGQDDDDNQPIIPIIPQDPMTMDQATEELIEEEEEPFQRALAFRADGGRVGAQEGGIMPRLNQLSGNVSSAEQMLQEINQRLESAESSLGSGGGQATFELAGGNTTTQLPMNLASDVATSAGVTGGPQVTDLKTLYPNAGQEKIDPPIYMRPGNIPGTDVPFSTFRSQIGNGFYEMNAGLGQPLGSPLQQAVGMADGGIMNTDIVGGMMDGNMDEMGRQMYGLGKLVKKATRAVKKIVKSPIGKAALLYTGAGALGNLAGGSGLAGMFKGFTSPSAFLSRSKLGGIFSREGLKNILVGGKDYFGERARDYTPFSGLLGKGGELGFGKVATLASVLPFFGLGTGDETEEEAARLLDNSGFDLNEVRKSIQNAGTAADRRMLSARADGGLMRLGYQEGGDAEPVAKKTMPLLDMGGKEKDYRETGGFVDMGRMERADDVPARLSKNEFVFTADAVRNAGDGDIDKGAEVMYNMMKNLENGGDVSEESQGLEGARKMFQTSQRLEEVL